MEKTQNNWNNFIENIFPKMNFIEKKFKKNCQIGGKDFIEFLKAAYLCREPMTDEEFRKEYGLPEDFLPKLQKMVIGIEYYSHTITFFERLKEKIKLLWRNGIRIRLKSVRRKA